MNYCCKLKQTNKCKRCSSSGSLVVDGTTCLKCRDLIYLPFILQWHHNESDGISNQQCLDCLLNPLSRCRSKKTSKLGVTGLCEGWPVNSPHKGPVTRKMFPFDNIIMMLWHADVHLWDCNVIEKNQCNFEKSHNTFKIEIVSYQCSSFSFREKMW